MPTIGEVPRSGKAHAGRRLLVGVGFTLVGALLVGLGAAGTMSGIAAKTGLVIGGVVVLGSLATLALRAPLRDHERDIVAIGVVIGLASVLFLWALTPTAILASPALTVAGGFGYLAGVAVVLAAILAGVSMNRSDSRGQRDSVEVAWTRSTNNDRVRSQVADGGDSDNDLSFPLEED